MAPLRVGLVQQKHLARWALFLLAPVGALALLVGAVRPLTNVQGILPMDVRYSTLVGGTGTDDCDAIAVDAVGAVYLGCHSSSPDFPGAAGVASGLVGGMDAFVVKLSPDGQSIDYVTQLGGTEWEAVQGIAVDEAGFVAVVGATYSTDLSTTSAAAQPGFRGGEGDAFVALLDPDGAVVHLTYVGGAGADDGSGVALDDAGNVYVVGRTSSMDFPVSEGALQPTLGGGQDAFVMKLSRTGEVLYSTYLGGGADDAAWTVAVARDGRVHVGGETGSGDFPSVGAVQARHGGLSDGFLAILNESGSRLEFATFLGGSGDDEVTSIALDPEHRLHVAGLTRSSDFMVTMSAFQRTPGGGRDAFLLQLSSLGTEVIYSSYLGGSNHESRAQVVVGADGEVFVAGGTSSPDFPTISPLQRSLPGTGGGYVVGFDRERRPAFATYFGGGASDLFEGAAPDPRGGLVVTGMTGSADFPMTGGLGKEFAGGRGDIPVVWFSALDR